MRKPERLKLIYAELRRAGVEASAGDLLRLAHHILRAYTSSENDLDDFRVPVTRAFFALPIDEAMEDGGWRILNFEEHRNFGIDDVDPEDMAVLKIHLGKLLGPEWRQAIRED